MDAPQARRSRLPSNPILGSAPAHRSRPPMPSAGRLLCDPPSTTSVRGRARPRTRAALRPAAPLPTTVTPRLIGSRRFIDRRRIVHRRSPSVAFSMPIERVGNSRGSQCRTHARVPGRGRDRPDRRRRRARAPHQLHGCWQPDGDPRGRPGRARRDDGRMDPAGRDRIDQGLSLRPSGQRLERPCRPTAGRYRHRK